MKTLSGSPRPVRRIRLRQANLNAKFFSRIALVTRFSFKTAGMLLFLAACLPASAQTYSVLTNFSGANGDSPRGGLAISGNMLFGTTFSGGASNKGTVFKLNTDASGLTIVKNFGGNDGENPSGSVILYGNTLFGAAYSGGFSNVSLNSPSGTLFRLNADGTEFGVLRQFNHRSLGLHPNGGMLITNGIIYGTTEAGGRDFGVIYRINTNGSRFRTIKPFKTNRGTGPNDTLVFSDNRLYGTTKGGGQYGYGTLFRLHAPGGGGFNVMKDFGDRTAQERNPSAGLNVIGDKPRDRLLYGTTELGNGPNANGTLFSARVRTRRYSAGVTNVADLHDDAPGFSKLLLSGATFYGTAVSNGVFGLGTVFKIKTDGTGYTVLHNFNGSDGAYPEGDLILSGGNLYGTTRAGGASDKGVVFSLGAASDAPQIVIGPKSQSIPAGSPVTFTVSASGAAPLQYQWRFGGNPIGGATSNSYSLSVVQSNDAGAYTVVVTNGFGSVTSAVASLTVLASNAPVITSQPPSITAVMGSNILLSVTANGSPTLKYQWFRDDVLVSGATSSSYSIPHAQTNDEADYYVVITNSFGKVTSDVATVTILDTGLAITDQPDSLTNIIGDTASFSVAAEGFEPFAYQWWKNGAPLTGQTNDTFELTDVSTNDAGNYLVVVNNSYGSVTSTIATLTVRLPDVPVIVTQPQNFTGYAGTNASFTVIASGGMPLMYQLWKDGSPLAGKTNATCSLTNIQAGDAGNYFVVITNNVGSATSTVARLTVNAADLPAITVQPQSQTVAEGGTALFSVTATGTPTLRYQWWHGTDLLTGKTNASYSLSNVRSNSAGGYFVVVANYFGSVTSAVATLTVVSSNLPAITTQPQSVTNYAGSDVSFSVAATGPGTISYQWWHGTTLVSGKTNTTCSLTNIQSGDAGNYYAVVSNGNGNVTSIIARLTVLPLTPPGITSQPQDVTDYVGASASFTVSATGPGTFTYQWLKNGTTVVGLTSAAYNITNLQVSDAGNYSVIVSNNYGSVTSLVAVLTVLTLDPPTIVAQPQSMSSLPGLPVTMSVSAIGLGTLTYQWFFEDVPITNATNVSYTISNADTNSEGDYSVVVSNPYGSTPSDIATLTVLSDPLVITDQPDSITNQVHSAAIFGVAAEGFDPLSYQWWKDGGPLGDETNDSLTITGVDPDDAGNYFVVITNAYGSVTSDVATLTVTLPIPNYYTWILSGNGDWDVPSNWSPTGVPGAADTAVITLGYTVSISDGTSVSNLNLSNAKLIGEQLKIRGAMNWSSGTVAADVLVKSNALANWLGGDLIGSLTVAVGGSLTVSNAVTIGFDNGNHTPGALTNNGTALWAGYIYGYGGDLIYNAGLWQTPGDFTLADGTSGSTNSFINTGTLQKTGGTGNSTFNWRFNTAGIVNTDTGALNVAQWTGSSILHGRLNFTGDRINAPLTVASDGVLNWLGGDLISSLTVAAGGTLTVSNTVTIGFDNGHHTPGALTNNGTVLWAGSIYGYGGDMIYNAGLWQTPGDFSLVDGTTGSTNTFINTGTLRKTGGTGNSTIQWFLSTTGIVDEPGGTMVANWDGTSTLHGTMNWSGGNMIGSLTIAADAVLNWSGGTVARPLTVASNATLNWSGGDLISSLTVAAGGSLRVSNTVTIGFDNGSHTPGALTNNGTALWAGSIYGYGGDLIYNAGLWQTPDDFSLIDGTAGSTNSFVNTGILQKTGGTGNSTFNWRFNTTGIVNTDTGALNVAQWTGSSILHGRLNFNGDRINAPLIVASDGVLNWLSGDLISSLTVAAGGTLTVSNTVTIGFDNGRHTPGALTNNGTVLWAGSIYGYGGDLIYNAGLWQTPGDFSLVDGTGGSTNFFVNIGTLQKMGGTGSSSTAWRFNTTGTVNTDAGALNVAQWTGSSVLHGTLNLNGDRINAPLTVASDGVLNWFSGDLISALTIDAGGTLTVSNTVTIGWDNGNHTPGALTNNGTVLWAANIYAYGADVIYNAGLWQTPTDFSLIDGAGGITNTFINAGTFLKSAGASSSSIQWPFYTSGNVTLLAGTLVLNNVALQTAGLTSLQGGILSPSQPFQLQGGMLAGINSVNGSVTNSGGVVSPGLSPGQLTITGDYSQTGNGALQIDLPTTLAGPNSDRLIVNGIAQLGGSLRLGLGAGLPLTGTYTILTANSRAGFFNGILYPTNILGFGLSYAPASVSVTVTNSQSPPSPTIVFDPSVNGTNFNVCFAGEVGGTYTIECATNLTPPVIWMKLSNPMGSFTDQGCGAGAISLHDAITASPDRFYRVVYPAY